jgi:hypothetical protein
LGTNKKNDLDEIGTIGITEKVDKGIRELLLTGEKINFNSVSNLIGVSKTFMYNNKEVKERIEELRQKQVNMEMNKTI